MARPIRKPKRPAAGRASGRTPQPVAGLRIIGGQFRGRRLRYGGDPRTRPMKDRLREAVFNLIGPMVRGTHALDLFAGTGALGLEALEPRRRPSHSDRAAPAHRRSDPRERGGVGCAGTGGSGRRQRLRLVARANGIWVPCPRLPWA